MTRSIGRVAILLVGLVIGAGSIFGLLYLTPIIQTSNFRTGNANDFKTVQDSLKTVEQSISELKTEISLIQNSVSNISRNLTAQDQRIGSLTKDLQDMGKPGQRQPNPAPVPPLEALPIYATPVPFVVSASITSGPAGSFTISCNSAGAVGEIVFKNLGGGDVSIQEISITYHKDTFRATNNSLTFTTTCGRLGSGGLTKVYIGGRPVPNWNEFVSGTVLFSASGNRVPFEFARVVQQTISSASFNSGPAGAFTWRCVNPAVGSLTLTNSGSANAMIAGVTLTYGGVTAAPTIASNSTVVASCGTVPAGGSTSISLNGLPMPASAGQTYMVAVSLTNGVMVEFRGTFK